MKYILSNNFQTDFENAWLDFCSRNIFNGTFADMNNNLYYHIDQVDLQPPTYAIDYLYDDYTFNGLVVLEEAIGTIQMAIEKGISREEATETITFINRQPVPVEFKPRAPELQRIFVARLYNEIEQHNSF